jgi:hypothetical protein
VERTHPEKSLHRFNALNVSIMSNEVMLALALNQGHALAMVSEEKK